MTAEPLQNPLKETYLGGDIPKLHETVTKMYGMGHLDLDQKQKWEDFLKKEKARPPKRIIPVNHFKSLPLLKAVTAKPAVSHPNPRLIEFINTRQKRESQDVKVCTIFLSVRIFHTFYQGPWYLNFNINA